MSIFGKLKPRFFILKQTADERAKYLVNFPLLWKSTVLLTAGVALVPLIFITAVDYNVTQKSIESEFLLRTSRIVSNTRRTISFFISERKASLDFIVYDNDPEQLEDPARLAAILENLKKGFGGFVDLGVIDSTGRQSNYVGPYKLRDKNYSDQKWYKQVMHRHVYISEVFLGYRKKPHIVIAVKHDLPNDSFFILRASLDIELFKNLLSRLELSGSGDAFIINHSGILQTPSRGHGRILEKASVLIPEFSPKTEVLEEKGPDGEVLLIGYNYIEGTPFILIIVKKRRLLMKSWQDTRLRLIAFLAVSVIVILAVILSTVTYMVNKIYIADEKRVAALHHAEYANKMASIGRLASGVAHEINNPLAIINEKAGLIKDLLTLKQTYSYDDKLVGLVDAILSSVKRCGRITRRLLNFARHMDVSIESIKLDDLIHDVLGFLEKEAEYRSIVVSINMQDIPEFQTDRGKLQQVLLNIINNAFAAMDDGGHLDIMAEGKGNGLVSISIADDGQGIPEGEIKHIFEPFFSTKTGQGGTGLGLSITYGLVQELGGDISVWSKPGEGTRFTISLPLNINEKGNSKI
ncbi:MAG: sensor histidine kinase [Desulfatiglans sp.]|jgi:signal transduction histidine kinase|nr:sensor histidine kinase [Thermodesulfobacteriota bacterium]MEE4353111.1 sensor histidine kinase [Desulfatiglans sp.]